MKNMNHSGKRLAVGKLFRSLFAVTLVAILSACGGGGGSAGSTGSSGSADSGGTVTNNGSIQLTLVDQVGVATNLISGSGGLLAKALVLTSSGAPVGAGVLVTFSLDTTIATLSATTGTALTGSDGIATMGLKAGVGTGAGTLTASAVAVGTTAITKSVTFEVKASVNATPTSIKFSSAVPADTSIVIKGAGGNGRSEVAILTFTVADKTDLGISNVKVNFSVPTGTPVVLGASSGITDPSGKVTVAVNSGDTPVSVAVTATVDGTSIFTKSDTVAVTTGLPSASRFSIGPEKPGMEGMNHLGLQDKISAYLADVNGGVVADGVPIVFTTDGGAIIGDEGTKATARCLTKNGACSVVWVSQAPFRSVVTIVATTTNGTETLQQSTYIVNSTSHGAIVGLPASWTFSSCVAKLFDVTVVDENGYPMPIDTTITFTGTNVSGSVLPNKVPPPKTTAQTGTSHTITLTPVTGCATGTGKALIELKTPQGDTTVTSVNVIYP
jgi:hypothetical protein